MGVRSVLIVAELSEDERRALEQDFYDSDLEATWLTSADMLASKLISGKFDALVVHLQTPGAARACLEAKSAVTRVRFPLLVLSEHVDNGTFHKALRVEADDVVGLDGSARISQRLAPIEKPNWKTLDHSRGEALVVDPDRSRADALARLLKGAGFLVKCVRDEQTARLHFGRAAIQLVVLDAGTQDAAALVEAANRQEWDTVWVARVRPEQLDEVVQSLAPFENASAVNTYLGAADVLFEANRLRARTSRAEQSLLYGDLVTFESAGGRWHERGFCYRIALDSVVVRTLALPPAPEIELTLTAPGQDHPLKLMGEVSERRVFAPPERQTSPPGFTVRLTGGELDAWREAVRAAYRQRFGKEPAAVQVREPQPPARPRPPTLKSADAEAPKSADAEAPKNTAAERAPVPPESTAKATSTKGPAAEVPNDENLDDVGEPIRPSLVHIVGGVSTPAPDTVAEGTEPPPSPAPAREKQQAPEPSPKPKPHALAATQRSHLSSAEARKAALSSREPLEPGRQKPRAQAQRPAQRMRAPQPTAPSERSSKPRGRLLALALFLMGVIAAAVLLNSRTRPGGASTSASTSRPLLGLSSSEDTRRVQALTSPSARHPGDREGPTTALTPTNSVARDAAEAESPELEPAGTAEASPAASASGNTGTKTPPLPAGEVAPADLPGHLGYLYVASPLDTQVFVQGRLVGKTNTHLKTFCGRRYVRLGSSAGHWQSPGVTFRIGCQKLNHLTITPKGGTR